MVSYLFKGQRIVSLIIWTFFSFSAVRLISAVVYPVQDGYPVFMGLSFFYSLFFFLFWFLFKRWFSHSLNYGQYILYNMVYGLLILGFSYLYYFLVMLRNDFYSWNYHIWLFVFNLVVVSFLFLFTLISKK
jgi:hypothetical protein